MPLPTLPGCLLGLAVFLGLIVVVALNIVSFLCEEAEVASEVLVVEGWIADYHAERITKDFAEKGYRKLYTTGGPVGKGFILSGYQSMAEITADTLVEVGVDKDSVVAAPAADTYRHRTYESAVALKAKLAKDGLNPEALMVYTDSVHARRTRMVYEKVFGPGMNIGTVAMESLEYDMDAWWKSSAGVKRVVMETIALAYEWVGDSGR